MLLTLSALFSIFLPHIENIINIVGGFGATFVAIFFPMWIHVSISDKRWIAPENFNVVIANVFFTSMGMIASIISLIKMIFGVIS